MLFLGLLFNRNEEHLIASKSRNGTIQNQVNAFQWNCIDGLYENGVTDLTIINVLPVGTYPRMYSDAVIPSKMWTYNGRKHFQIGSLNFPIFKQIGRCHACKKIIKKLDDKEILIYSAYQPFLKAVKKLDTSYKITLIVPDLPEYYDYAKVGKIKRVLRKINNLSIDKCMKRVNRFVLLTEAMKEPLKVGNRPYVVVEGISTFKTLEKARNKFLDKKAVLYAGSLNKQFGIDVLIEAFEQIPNEDYELWICGGGDYQEQVKQAVARDCRIKFLGFLTKDKVLELQSKSTVVVNPRQNIGEYTKYSFPSKTMEYLLSGVPVVAYKLDGIPDEYDPYLVYVKDNSPQSLALTLCDVCEDSDGYYEQMAKKAADFIIRKKNPVTQTAKVIELIRENI